MRTAALVLGATALLGCGAASAGSEAASFRVQVGSTSRTPAVGARWVFRIAVVDARGRPVGGTASVRVLVDGRVVDTIGWFSFKRTLRRVYRWSPEFAGTRVVLQATVTSQGVTRTGRHAVLIRPDVNLVEGRPAFRTIVRAATRRPVARAPWRFSVRAFGKRGRPVGVTAVARVVRASRVVDTIGWFSFKGSVRRTYRWPRSLEGLAVFQVKVSGPGGTRTVGFAIRVR